MEKPEFWRRFVACLFDYVVYYALVFAYLFVFGEASDAGYRVEGLVALPVFSFWFVYFPGAEALFQQTFGKGILGIRVVRLNGSEVGFGTALRRHLLDIPDMLLALFLPFIVLKRPPYVQRLGDLWAGTTVVRDEAVHCPLCSGDVVMQGHEVLRRRFNCPYCKQYVDLGVHEHA